MSRCASEPQQLLGVSVSSQQTLKQSACAYLGAPSGPTSSLPLHSLISLHHPVALVLQTQEPSFSVVFDSLSSVLTQGPCTYGSLCLACRQFSLALCLLTQGAAPSFQSSGQGCDCIRLQIGCLLNRKAHEGGASSVFFLSGSPMPMVTSHPHETFNRYLLGGRKEVQD